MRTSLFKKIPLYLFLIVVLLVYLIPLFNVLNTALKTNTDFLNNPLGLPVNIYFANFPVAWKEASLGLYAFNSLYYTIVCVSISLVLALFIAFPISRKFFKANNFIYMAFVAGMFLPSGIIPLWRMIYAAGLYDTSVGYMLTIVSGGGITFFFFVSYIKNLPIELDEAACIDGCGYIRYVFVIIVPLMRPAIATMAVLSAINVWNEIVNSVIFLSNPSLFPITRGLYMFKGQYFIEWPLLCAALVIVAIPMVIFYLILQKQIIDGIVAGGVKE